VAALMLVKNTVCSLLDNQSLLQKEKKKRNIDEQK
jgi:hypothetical protein